MAHELLGVTQLRLSLRLSAGLALLLISIAPVTLPQSLGQTSPADWSQVPAILARIVPPSFPSVDFAVTDYGAVGNGVTDCTQAFASAIVACNRAGGGRVVVPAGTYFTGAIRLLSNVNLYLAKNSVIRFSTNTQAYLPVVYTRSGGVEVMNYSPFLYAFEQQNIAVTGEGVLDGQATSTSGPWYSWTQSGAEAADNRLLAAMAATNLPVAQRVFGAGHCLRPVFVQPFRCRNVLIEGVILTNPPMWTFNPVYCTNVTVSGLTVNTSGPNTDGCDPDSCTDVLLKNCTFNTGDDCTAIKSGKDADGLRVNIPSQNIVYQNCLFKQGRGGVTCGSETSGGISNIYAENCRFNSAYQNIALRFKSCPQRGGGIQNVYVRNCSIEQAATGISLIMNYCSGGTNIPIMRNFDIRDCFFGKLSGAALIVQGLDKSHTITNLTIANCRFVSTGASNSVSYGTVNSMNNRGGGF